MSRSCLFLGIINNLVFLVAVHISSTIYGFILSLKKLADFYLCVRSYAKLLSYNNKMGARRDFCFQANYNPLRGNKTKPSSNLT